jgi:hypothetical protein
MRSEVPPNYDYTLDARSSILLRHYTARRRSVSANEHADTELKPWWLEWAIGLMGSLPMILVFTALLMWLAPQ